MFIEMALPIGFFIVFAVLLYFIMKNNDSTRCTIPELWRWDAYHKHRIPFDNLIKVVDDVFKEYPGVDTLQDGIKIKAFRIIQLSKEINELTEGQEHNPGMKVLILSEKLIEETDRGTRDIYISLLELYKNEFLSRYFTKCHQEYLENNR